MFETSSYAVTSFVNGSIRLSHFLLATISMGLLVNEHYH
jgi:hypothetical protein